MERKTVLLIGFCILFMILTGCGKNTSHSASEEEPKIVTGSEDGTGAGPSGTAKDPEEKTESDEPENAEVLTDPEKPDVLDLVKTEEEVDLAKEDTQAALSEEDAVLSDTVEYVESDKVEILETRYVESVVDENDPATYKVVTKEQKVEKVEEIPVEYLDSSGNVKYTFRDGVWYYRKYSSGEITMTEEEDTEDVLLLMNLFGEYDDYEVVDMECNVLTEEDMEPQYAYRVLYCKEEALSELPDDLENLTVSRTRQEITTQIETVEEKVPVMLEKKVGTGMYVYYGWQELDGDTYYFDKNGEKVRGTQVINGICYQFDEHGVLLEGSGVNVSSRKGSIDWKAVRRAGIEFAMIRCGYRGSSEGMLVQDSRCEENIVGARREGLDTAIWFYSQAVTEKEAAEEAAYVTAIAEKYGISAPLVLVMGYSGDRKGRADGLSVEERTACAAAFCKAVQDAGHTPMICGTEDWLNHCLDRSRLGGYPVWLIQYNSDMTYTIPCEIWQYTGKAVIDGISGHTGLSIRP